jgi:hypothetical protein
VKTGLSRLILSVGTVRRPVLPAEGGCDSWWEAVPGLRSENDESQ